MAEIGSKKQRRIDTDEAILDAALIEISNWGYSNAKLTDIAKRAGISIGLIGQNFGSKEEMLIALVKRESIKFFADFKNFGETLWQNIFKKGYEKIYQIFSENSEESKARLKFFCVLYNGFDMPKESLNIMQNYLDSRPVIPALIEGQKKGEVKDGEPIRLIGLFFKTCVIVFTHCQIFHIEPPRVEWFMQLLRK